MRKLLAALLVPTLVGGVLALAPASNAATPQIVDPALDHPAPWADIVSVQLKVVTTKGREYLETAFTMSGDITDPSRNVMTGYSFRGKVGTCELTVLWYAYPMVTEPAGLPTGSAGTACANSTKDYGGTFKYKGKTVTVTSPLQDLKPKGVVRGATMTNLTAWTAPVEGFAGDPPTADDRSEPRVLKLLGDAASSTKPWTVG